jgi:hypothetical protein
MNNQPQITVILANRPRLFRELLQHALKTEAPQVRVVEAADGSPSPALLRESTWLVVDEDSVPVANKVAAAYPRLGILALEGRGSSLRLVSPLGALQEQATTQIPTLEQLLDLLTHPVIEVVQ